MHASHVGGVDNNRMFIRTHYQMFSGALHLDEFSMFLFPREAERLQKSSF